MTMCLTISGHGGTGCAFLNLIIVQDQYLIVCSNRLIDDVSYERMRKGLEDVKSRFEGGRSASSLVRILLGEEEPLIPSSDSTDLEFFSQTLNPPQKDAVSFAVRSPQLCLIHGPPGTGKTTVLVEIIQQLLKQGKRLLVCAPSNIAVGMPRVSSRLLIALTPCGRQHY